MRRQSVLLVSAGATLPRFLGPLKTSRFLDNKMLYDILPMLPVRLRSVSLTLLYDSKSGLSAAPFDAAVKNKSNVLTVIKASTNYVFGCFVADTYGQSGGWIVGNVDNFIFGLGCRDNSGGAPTPIKLVKSGSNSGVYISSCGVYMGNDGALIAFCSHSTAKSSIYHPDAAYASVPYTATTLAGVSGSYTP